MVACASQFAFAEDPATEAPVEVEAVDPAMLEEIKYVKALVDGGFSDLAERVIAATKKQWPESEAELFAVEIRGLLLLGKFDEAEKKIASLPDRKSSKYWAARIELGSFYFLRGRKEEGKQVYDQFFSAFKTPPKDLMGTYVNAAFTWGQLLVKDRRFAEAVDVYAVLLTQKLDAIQMGGVLCEASDISLRLASETEDMKKRGAILDRAEPWIDRLLDNPDQPIYFGRAVNMKAHSTLLRGNIERAQGLVEDYLPQLSELHDAIKAADPEGKNGSLRLSPMPQCRYLLAEMLWTEALEESKKQKPDDERIKSLMFGERMENGKRNGQGAYNHSLNVFLLYPESTWAPTAGELADEIAAFAREKYGANIKSNITPEMIAKVRANQFKGAANKQLEGDNEGAAEEFLEVLARYPETPESLPAIEALATAYLDLMVKADLEKKDALKEEYRDYASAVEGYIAERFNEFADRKMMTAAGDALIRLANKEKERGQLARELEVKRMFGELYVNHPNAAGAVMAIAMDAQKNEKYEEAIELWKVILKNYEKSPYYSSAFAQISQCYTKLGDRQKAINSLLKYVEVEQNALQQSQAQMQLAQMYKDNGFDMLKEAETNATPEAVEKQMKLGSAQIIRGIKQFNDLAVKAASAIAEPTTPIGEKEKYSELREAGLFLVGDSYGRITKPESKLEAFRKLSANSFEEYVKAYPKGKYAKPAYVKLGTIYTALGDMDSSKGALERLSKEFPDSDEAKNAKPRLAKSLIEMGMKKEGTEIYAEMLRVDGAYNANHFVNAGEALIDAQAWDLANQAFEKAIAKAGTNQVSSAAKARIGQAKSLYRQKRYVESRDALDLFLADQKMSKLGIAEEAYLLIIEVASEQGRTEKDAGVRAKDFGAAIGAVKKMRAYWGKKEQWEQDSLDLMSADVTIRKMKAEEAMGLKEEALETCARAAAQLQSFLQARAVSADHPADKMSAGELKNLERCYATMIPLFSKMGADQADRVIKFGKEYLDLFPNGKAKTEIVNCINQAQAMSSAPKAAAQKQEEK